MTNYEIAQKWKVSSVAVAGILADAAPLVAVTDNAIMQLIDAQYLNGSIRLTWENNSGERVLTDVCKRFTDGIIAAATQVSPQATVEPLTDLQIAQLSDDFVRGNWASIGPAFTE